MNSSPKRTGTGRTALLAVLMGAIVFGAVDPAWARDIRVGGQSFTDKPPPNMIALPVISAAKQADDGRYQIVQIEAWLAPRDLHEVAILEDRKSAISMRAKQAFPEQNFEVLMGSRDGSALAKKTIQQATESELGHPWTGDVLIKTMLVY